jgi:N-acetylmuramoyl-L-alanine amidase
MRPAARPCTVPALLLGLLLMFALGAAPVLAQAPARPYVAIDPGHGDTDVGAVGVLAPGTVTGLPPRTDRQGRAVMYEKDVNLDIAQRLDGHLRAWGARTLMTRTGDLAGGDRPYTTVGADLKARTDIANEAGVDLFVSIHNNAIGSPAVSGTETFHYYYSTEASRRLAREIQQELVRALGLPDRGVKEAGFYVLRHTRMPAVLVEGAFLTNQGDLALLADPSVRQRIADAIGRGVRRTWLNAPDEIRAAPALPPTIGPWVRRPARVPAGYRLVRTGRANPVGKGGWLAVRADLTFPRAEHAPTIGPWARRPARVPDGYRLVKTGRNNPIGKGGWLAVRTA